MGVRFAGTLYGVVTLACGATFVVLALQLRRSQESDRQAAQRLFVYSISYLFLLFAALLANSSGDQSSSTVSSREDAWRITRTVRSQPCRYRSELQSPSALQSKTRPKMRYGLLAVTLLSVTLGGCSEGVLNPKGPLLRPNG